VKVSPSGGSGRAEGSAAASMIAQRLSRPTGSVFRLEKARGPSWWAKYRLPNGAQVKRKIGPAWTGRGRPAAG
jgi:hypothetical protein